MSKGQLLSYLLFTAGLVVAIVIMWRARRKD